MAAGHTSCEELLRPREGDAMEDEVVVQGREACEEGEGLLQSGEKRRQRLLKAAVHGKGCRTRQSSTCRIRLPAP